MENPENTVEGTGPISVVVTWRVRKGREEKFKEWRHEIGPAALKFPGHLGITVIPTGGDEREYVVIFRFDTYEHLRDWQTSEIRKELLKKAEPLTEKAPSYRMESGLDFWFTPLGTPTSPPLWKMAIVTAVGVWPASILIPWLLNPLINGLPLVLQALIIAFGIVILLTWVIMPVLTRMLGFWLNPSK